jgi:MoxR-like ATPase
MKSSDPGTEGSAALAAPAAKKRHLTRLTSVQVGPLDFLAGSASGEPFSPSRCWLVPGTERDDAWVVHLVPPSVAPGGAVELTDLKRWMLFEEEDERLLTVHHPATAHRTARRDHILSGYLTALLRRVEHAEARQVWVLMPSIQDEARRRRYREAIQTAIPTARTLPEPEMVLEYFRLVKRELKLERGQTGIFLVIDVGAATCNMTFILTRRDEKVVEAADGRERTRRLRAVSGDSNAFAGHWVDHSIATALGINQKGLDHAARNELWSGLERAKCRVSTTGDTVVFRPPGSPTVKTITTELLSEIGASLWTNLVPLYLASCERLLSQLRGTDYAKQLASNSLQGVRAPDDVSRLIDAVILAGGTSQLPGFESAMRRHLELGANKIRLLRVGRDYATAAAVGGVAHVLHQYHKPSRLHGPADSDRSGLAQAALEGTLPYDIEFHWKEAKGATRSVTALTRDDPIVYTGGRRPIAELPQFKKDVLFHGRFVPSAQMKSLRQGLRPVPLNVRRAPGRIEMDWEPRLREARGFSEDLDARSLFLRVDEAIASPDKPSQFTIDVPPGHIGFENTPDVVVDLGMSKTVCVTATRTGVLPIRRLSSAGFDDSEHEPAPTSSGVRRSSELSLLGPRLASTFDYLDSRGGHAVPRKELTTLLLALATRPFVLLSGPPGCGKSSLARLAAQVILGPQSQDAFNEVTVQAHWNTDRHWFKPTEWRPGAFVGTKMVLFDEVNLTRPEYYLTRFFAAQEELASREGPNEPRVVACGTLNIDDTSRPPSPKILDRCFLIEFDAPKVMAGVSERVRFRDELEPEPLPRLPRQLQPTPETWRPIALVTETIQSAVEQGNLRQDLMCSYRSIADAQSFLAMVEASRVADAGLLKIDDAIDQIIASRILVKLSGSAQQVRPVVTALERVFKSLPYARSLRRIQLLNAQLELGFTSPWH